MSNSLLEGPWARTLVRDQALEVELPDAGNWSSPVDSSRAALPGAWTTLIHRASGSRLHFRHAPAERTVTRDQCQQRATLARVELQAPGEVAIERRRDVAGYHGRFLLRVLDSGRPVAALFAAGLSRCLAVVFTPGRGAPLPASLTVFSEQILPSVAPLFVAERAPEKPQL